jgi:hypothetical protein
VVTKLTGRDLDSILNLVDNPTDGPPRLSTEELARDLARLADELEDIERHLRRAALEGRLQPVERWELGYYQGDSDRRATMDAYRRARPSEFPPTWQEILAEHRRTLPWWKRSLRRSRVFYWIGQMVGLIVVAAIVSGVILGLVVAVEHL